MADRNGYIGRAPGDSSIVISRETFSPTGVQTDFTFSAGYIPGYLDVYLNGVRLIEADDYTATDTSIVGLTSAAQNGDVVEMVAYKAFNIAVVSEALSDFIVGNDLSVSGDVTVTGDHTTTGDVSGRNFTGVAATFTGNVTVGGVLSYEDVTSVDSIGVLTARTGVHVLAGGVDVDAGGINVDAGGLNVAGVTTLSQLITGNASFTGVTTVSQLTSGNVSLTGVTTISQLTSSNVALTGITTISNVVVGGATTELVVTGDARVTGILTVGTSSITINGSTGKITGASDTQLATISTEIVGTGTTVDVFVYDTSKDSDGGAWRKRTQNTSWYNETLNTSTRGSRREFPAVAVIVAETGQVTIYDGDDPDLPMWMVFNGTAGSASHNLLVDTGSFCLSALNGTVFMGALSIYVNFISEYSRGHRSTSGALYWNGPYNGNIAERNAGKGSTQLSDKLILGGSDDVAMTVLPNAPIDDATGLPIPTIAVATNGGLSVIKDDGTVVDWTEISGPDSTHRLSFRKDHKLGVFTSGTAGIDDYPQLYYIDIPSSDVSSDYYYNFTSLGIEKYGYEGETNREVRLVMKGNRNSSLVDVVDSADRTYAATDVALNIISRPESVGSTANMLTSMVSFATTSYNTGYQVGDIKGAFLSDTTAESVTANTNLAGDATEQGSGRLTSETYDSGDLSWQMVDNSGNANGYLNIYLNGLTVGKSYVISMTWDNNATLDSGYFHRVVHADATETIFSHWDKTNASSETLEGVFTANSVNSDRLSIYANAITLNVSNFSLKELEEEDRSVNNTGLEVTGTITKSAVATGADLVAYGPFSASNYFTIPQGVSDLSAAAYHSFIAWFNTSASTSGVLVQFGARATDQLRALWLDNNGYMNYTIYGTDLATTRTVNDGNWHCAVGLYDGTNYKIYLDGVLENTSVATGISFDDIGGSIGYSVGVSPQDPFDGLLALVRVSESALSPEQVKKIYEDEKVLFQENAKCTLYGSSDAVTALGYDDDEETLYVGTSSGRSDFRGLRRINNTTTAVTTAISASNGLVAEE